MFARVRYLVAFVLFAFCNVSTLSTDGGNCEKEKGRLEEDCNCNCNDEVKVSPKCAALLLVGGGVAGGTAAVVVTNMLMPMWLCYTGFCAAGVQSGSLAAWWQSTMPLVASGSMFATLQSIAMGSGGVFVNMGSSAAFGAAMGAAGATNHLRDFCQMIDQVDPDTVSGTAIQKNLEFYRGLSGAVKDAEPYLAEGRAAVARAAEQAAPYVAEAKAVAFDYLSNGWEWFSKTLEETQEAVRREGEPQQ